MLLYPNIRLLSWRRSLAVWEWLSIHHYIFPFCCCWIVKMNIYCILIHAALTKKGDPDKVQSYKHCYTNSGLNVIEGLWSALQRCLIEIKRLSRSRVVELDWGSSSVLGEERVWTFPLCHFFQSKCPSPLKLQLAAHHEKKYRHKLQISSPPPPLPHTHAHTQMSLRSFREWLKKWPPPLPLTQSILQYFIAVWSAVKMVGEKIMACLHNM